MNIENRAPVYAYKKRKYTRIEFGRFFCILCIPSENEH